MSRIFINYRRQDSEGYVGRLYDRLVQHFEASDVFMDVDNIPAGADFIVTLERAIANCDIFIAVIGPNWIGISDESGVRRLDQWNDFVRVEIASALQQNKLIIPVLVGRARMPNPSQLPDDIVGLARRNAIELSHERFGYDVDKLIERIRTAFSEIHRSKGPANVEAIIQKESALKALRLELVGATDSPLYAYRVENGYFPVLGDGNPDANIVFIGEAPGKNEAENGLPFIGPSGEVLAEMLASIGLRRDDVFMTNILLDRPPDREPTSEELDYYGPLVERIIHIIQPSVLVTLGRYAMTYWLKKLDLPEKRQKISQLHGKLLKTRLSYGEIYLVPLYHPAVVLYSASQKNTLQKDFQKLKLFV